jgi:hypothetical protein
VGRILGLKRAQDDVARSREHFYNALLLLLDDELRVSGGILRGVPAHDYEENRTDDPAKRAYNEGRLDDARRLLLEQYARKIPRRLIQIDGHRIQGDSIMDPDEDGHSRMYGEEYELRNIGSSDLLPVRVQIWEGAHKDEVLALLPKITDLPDEQFYDMQLRVQQVNDPEDPF